MTDIDDRATKKDGSRDGQLFLLKRVIELVVAIGAATLGAYITQDWGDFGKASASDIGWLLGFLLGICAIYLIENATIGWEWPQPRNPGQKPAWVFMIVTATFIAAGGIGGLSISGRLGGSIGGLLGLLTSVVLTSFLNRFKERGREHSKEA